VKQVFLSSLAIFLLSCGRTLPIEIFVEDSWQDDEAAAISKAIEGWNQVGALMNDPGPVFIEAGRAPDRYSREKTGDGRSVVYRLTGHPSFRLSKPLESAEGWQEGDDVAIALYMFPSEFPGSDGERHPSAVDQRTLYLRHLTALSLHEFGHLLGFGHVDSEYSVMCSDPSCYKLGPKPKDPLDWPEPKKVTEYDIGRFCRTYGCR